MLLVHKPIPFSSALSSHHRRLPSAPAVVVQPTRTPGLLSVKSPLRPTTRFNPQQQRPRVPFKKPYGPAVEKPSSPQHTQLLSHDDLQKADKYHVASDKAQDKPIEKLQTKLNTAPSPSPARGRQNRFGKEKPTKRSASLTSARAQSRRQPRQPSPHSISSQVEAPASSINADRLPATTPRHNNTNNAFDPFLVSSSDTDCSDSKTPSKKSSFNAMPTYNMPRLSKPSGKLAFRRQQAFNSPTPSKSIPVPRSKGRNVPAAGLSRSAPVGQPNIHPLPKFVPSQKAHFDKDMFPICDDLTDIDRETRPSTPVSKQAVWQKNSMFFDNGPKTAPLSSTSRSFPFGFETPSPSLQHARRNGHVRVPSEGVFNMSLDEDYAGSDASDELKALFAGMANGRRRLNKPSKEFFKSEAAKAPYFASSIFQNSPSPDDLPAPAFMH